MKNYRPAMNLPYRKGDAFIALLTYLLQNQDPLFSFSPRPPMSSLPPPSPEICHWIDVPLRAIRKRLEGHTSLIARAEGSFFFADDSLPEDLESPRASHSVNWRCLAAPRLHLLLQGEHVLSFVRNKRTETVRLRPGDIWFFPADAHDHETFTTSCCYLAVVFHVAFTRFVAVNHDAAAPAHGSTRSKQTGPERWSQAFHWHEKRPPAISSALEALTRALPPSSHNALIIEEAGLHLAKGLWLLLWHWLNHPAADPPPVGKAHSSWLGIDRFLQENYHRPLTRMLASQALGLHPNRISALCAEFAGKSFQHILEERRLRQAMRFLKSSDHKIEAIATFCGYTSSSYFSRTFRSVTGLPPGKWRIEHRTPVPRTKPGRRQ